MAAEGVVQQPQTFAEALSRTRELGAARLEKRSALAERAKAAWAKTREIGKTISVYALGATTREGATGIKNVAVEKAMPTLTDIGVGVITGVENVQQAAASVMAAPERVRELPSQVKDALRSHITEAGIRLQENASSLGLEIGNKKDLAVFDAKLQLLELQKAASEKISPVVSRAKDLGGRALNFFSRQKDAFISDRQANLSDVSARWNDAKAKVGEAGLNVTAGLGERFASLAVNRVDAQVNRTRAVALRQKATSVRMGPPRLRATVMQ